MDTEYQPSLRTVLRFLIATALTGVLLFVILASGLAVLNALTPLLVLLLLGAALVAMAAVLTAIGCYILGPLDRAARHGMRPTQFTMVDFLGLIKSQITAAPGAEANVDLRCP